MASFLKKALGVFVEFEEDQTAIPSTASPSPSSSSPAKTPQLSPEIARNPENHAEAEKFEKYFDKLFDKANLPGPDYYEFYKTMVTLEAHIPDENARLAATFASLSIQGLTKATLIESANKYKQIIEQDQVNFETVLNEKLSSEVGNKQTQLQKLEEKIKSNSAKIQELTKEISESQVMIGKVKTEVMEQENTLAKNKNGYKIACQAILNKITADIQRIITTI